MEAGEYHEDRDVIDCFDKIPTGNIDIHRSVLALWIAFEFISLTRFQQETAKIPSKASCCELLLNLYLWQDSNRHLWYCSVQKSVVNCFWIYIFDKIPTGQYRRELEQEALWIAFEFISLTRFQQVVYIIFNIRTVVNCFWIYIFDKIPTGYIRRWCSTISCELLLNLYLWQDSNRILVVLCCLCMLWIAFEFISLTRFQQV